jgi:hypothetical protein
MNCNEDHHNKKYTRRDFLTRTSLGMGALTLGGLLGPSPVLGKDLISQMVHRQWIGNPSLCAKSKKGHLSFSKRCSISTRFI